MNIRFHIIHGTFRKKTYVFPLSNRKYNANNLRISCAEEFRTHKHGDSVSYFEKIGFLGS